VCGGRTSLYWSTHFQHANNMYGSLSVGDEKSIPALKNNMLWDMTHALDSILGSYSIPGTGFSPMHIQSKMPALWFVRALTGSIACFCMVSRVLCAKATSNPCFFRVIHSADESVVLCAFDNRKNFRHFWIRTEVDRNVLFDLFCVSSRVVQQMRRDSLALYCMCTYSAHKNGQEKKE
jgi:hypothetical protein